MARFLVVFAGNYRRSYVLKTGSDVADLGVECLCENGGLVYNAMAYAAGYCNISINKPEKKKKPCDMSLAGLSHGLRPIGLDELTFTRNNTVIIREGQGLSPLLSSTLAPSPHIGGLHGNYFSSRLLRTKYVHSAICSCRPTLVGGCEQAAECRLVAVCTCCVTGNKKGRTRQYPAFVFVLTITFVSVTKAEPTAFVGSLSREGSLHPAVIV
jgi:hypothetical protein